MNRRNHPRPFALTLLLAGALLLPSMATVGMFFDGMIYASLSRNLALGHGSAWAPYFSEGLFPQFHQHPPLVFWLQAPLFALFGDPWWVERAYDLGLVIATALLLRVLWRQLINAAGRADLAGYWWLALLCWILVPKWSWTYRNNLLENTLTLTSLAAVVLLMLALRVGSWRRVARPAVGAGLLTVAGVLIKGPVALFVVAAPILLAVATPDAGIRATLRAVVPFLVALAAGALIVLAIPEARLMLDEYLRRQLLNRVGFGERDGAMLLELLTKLAPMLLVVAVAVITAKMRRKPGSGGTGRAVAAMLAVGFSASLPLALGDFDSAHYLVPSLPYFAIGFGLLAAARLDDAGLRPRLQRTPGRGFRIVVTGLAVALIVACGARWGEVRKNREAHAFFDSVAEVTGDGAVLGIDHSLYGDWTLHGVAQRYHRISLVRSGDLNWRLIPAASLPDGTNTAAVWQPPWALVACAEEDSQNESTDEHRITLEPQINADTRRYTQISQKLRNAKTKLLVLLRDRLMTESLFLICVYLRGSTFICGWNGFSFVHPWTEFSRSGHAMIRGR